MAMESYVEAEELIANAWGVHPFPGVSVEDRINLLLNQGAIRGNEIIVLVQTALSKETED